MALLQPGFVLRCEDPVDIWDHATAQGLYYHLGLRTLESRDHAAAGLMVIWEAFAATLVHGNIWTNLLLMAMSKFMVLPELGSVLISTACVTTSVHVNHVLKHALKCKGLDELEQPLTGPKRAPNNQRADPAPCWPHIHTWESWSLPHHSCERAGPAPHLRGVVPAAEND